MKIHLSWLFLIVGALWGATLVAERQVAGAPVGVVLGYAYALWALFWGLPPFWSWLRRVFPPLNGGPLYLVPIRLAVWLSVALIGGVYFSLFGGGIFHFLRDWWTVRGHA